MKQYLKRGMSLLLALAMCLTLLPAAALATDSDLWTDHAQEVTPNADGVYEISTAAELAYVAAGVNGGTLRQYYQDENWDTQYYTFRLTADIDLSAHEWVPIGNSRNRDFLSVFDGGGHTISGLRIGMEDEPNTELGLVGLFGWLSGSVSDLRIEDAAIYSDKQSGSEDSTDSYVGILAGYCDSYRGFVRYCEVSGSVYTGGTSYGNNDYGAAGGLFGHVEGSVIDSCRATVTLGALNPERSAALGGIAAVAGYYDSTSIKNCVTAVTTSIPEGMNGVEVDPLIVSGGNCALYNSVGVGDYSGARAQYTKSGSYQNVCFTETNVSVYSNTTYDYEQTAARYLYYDAEGAEQSKDAAAMKSADFLATLNETAGMIDGAKQWSAGAGGFPTVARAGLRPYHTVTFNSVANPKYAVQTVADGETAARPEDPERRGYTFLWWYTGDDTETPFDFDAPITADTVIAARYDAHGYTVLFDSMGGSYVYPQAVRQDQRIAAPAEPVNHGFVFGGWFTDDTLETPWNFDTDTAQGDMTLYARWTRESGFAVTGRVTEQDTGVSVAGASVRLSNGKNALTDAFGYYRISGVSSGVYTVTAEAAGYVTDAQEGFEITDASRSHDVALAADTTGSHADTATVYVNVSCVFSSIVLQGVDVMLDGGELGSYAAVTDQNGYAEFISLPGGAYTFYINERGGRPGWESYVTPEAQELHGSYNLTCALKPHYQQLTVTVTGYDPKTERDNVPLKGMTVTLNGYDPADTKRESPLLEAQATTDENGVANVEQLVPITWTVSAVGIGYEPSEETVYADGGGKFTKTAVALKPAFINSGLKVTLASDYADPDIFKKTTGSGTTSSKPSFGGSGRDLMTVDLVGVFGTLTEGIVRSRELDENGEATFDMLLPGTYGVAANGSVKRYVSIEAKGEPGERKEIYSSTEGTRYGPKYFYADFDGSGAASVALGETAEAVIPVTASPVSFSGTLYISDMNDDGSITTTPLANTEIRIKPSPYYPQLNTAWAEVENPDEADFSEGITLMTDADGWYGVTLNPGLYGVELVSSEYDDYFGGHLIYHEGATDEVYGDWETRGWPCVGEWTGTRASAWAWLSSGNGKPYGEISGMNLSSGTVVADLELMEKKFTYALGDRNLYSGVGINMETAAEMHLLTGCESPTAEEKSRWYGDYHNNFYTSNYHTESNGATVAMSGAASETRDMTGKRFPAVFSALEPGDYTFTYTLNDQLSHLDVETLEKDPNSNEWAWVPFTGRTVQFYDFPAPGQLPDAQHPFPEDYVDINNPNDEGNNPWPLGTCRDDDVSVAFDQDKPGHTSLDELYDDDPDNGGFYFQFYWLPSYTEEIIDMETKEVYAYHGKWSKVDGEWIHSEVWEFDHYEYPGQKRLKEIKENPGMYANFKVTKRGSSVTDAAMESPNIMDDGSYDPTGSYTPPDPPVGLLQSDASEPPGDAAAPETTEDQAELLADSGDGGSGGDENPYYITVSYSLYDPSKDIDQRAQYSNVRNPELADSYDFYTLAAYSTDKIPGKVFCVPQMRQNYYTRHSWDDELYTALPDGNVTLYFCSALDGRNWPLLGNMFVERNVQEHPKLKAMQQQDFWFSVELDRNASPTCQINFFTGEATGGAHVMTQEEVQNLLNPRTIRAQAVEFGNGDANTATLDVPVTITLTGIDGKPVTVSSAQPLANQTLTSRVSQVTVLSDEWECPNSSAVTGVMSETASDSGTSRTETFLVPLIRKQYGFELTVSDDAGNPVADADVTIEGAVRSEPVVRKTDKSGKVSLTPSENYSGQTVGGLTYQDYTVKVTAKGYTGKKLTVPAAELVAGTAQTIALPRLKQPTFVDGSVTQDRRGAFLPGVNYCGNEQEVDIVLNRVDNNLQFIMTIEAEVDLFQNDYITEYYLIDRKEFENKDFSDAPKPLQVPDCSADKYNPSELYAWLDSLKERNVFVQRYTGESYSGAIGFSKKENGDYTFDRMKLSALVPVYELPPDAFRPCLLVLTQRGAAQIYNIEYGEMDNSQLIGVRVGGFMGNYLNTIGAMANLKAVGGEAVSRGLEKLQASIPKMVTDTGCFIPIPSASFKADIQVDDDGYFTYDYELIGELITGLTYSPKTTGSFMSLAPMTTGMTTRAGMTLKVDGKRHAQENGYMVEMQAAQWSADEGRFGKLMDPANYMPAGMKNWLNGSDALPVKIEYEVTDPPSVLFTKKSTELFDAFNDTIPEETNVSLAGRFNVKSQLSAMKMASFAALPGVGSVLGKLIAKGVADAGLQARLLGGVSGNFKYTYLEGDHNKIDLGIGVGAGGSIYAKAFGEAVVGEAGFKLTGESQLPRLNDMVTLEFEMTKAKWFKPLAIAGNCAFQLDIKLRTWFLNGAKHWEWPFWKFRKEFGTETQFELAQIVVHQDNLMTRDDFTTSTFNAQPETLVNNLLPIGGYAADESGTFVYTDMAAKGGKMRVMLSEYAGDQTWNTPVTVAETDGVIPAYDVVSLDDGSYLVVWTEIAPEHMQETCPPSVVKCAVGTVIGGAWDGAAQTVEALPNEVASRLMLTRDGDNVFLAAVKTAEGAIAEHLSVSGYRFDGTTFGAAQELAKDEALYDAAAAAVNGGLMVAMMNGDGVVTTKQWNGSTVSAKTMQAALGNITLASNGTDAYLACKTDQGLSLYRSGDGWNRIATATDAPDASHASLALSDDVLVVTWSANSETDAGDMADAVNGTDNALNRKVLRDANLYAAVFETDGTRLTDAAELKAVTTGDSFRDSAALVLDNEIVLMSVQDGDETDMLNVYSGGALPTVVGKPQITADVSGGTITYAIENLPNGAKLIAARYDNGRMTDAKTLDHPGESGTVTLSGSGASFRLFLTDGSMKPLCKVWSST